MTYQDLMKENEQRKSQPPSLSHRGDVQLQVENMGGIKNAEVSLSEGVTLFTGENATNRTSVFRAIAGALGSEAGILKRDAERGSVTLSIDGTVYKREYVRQNGSIRKEGSPYANETDIVDLFVCLLEDNPIRRAMRGGADLRELLLAPVDTDELQSEIATLRSERNRIDERLTEIEREHERLPKLEQERTGLEDELADIESELQATRKEIAAFETESVETEQTELLLEKLEDYQGRLEEKKAELDTQRSIREELRENLVEVREELSEVTVQEDRLERIDQEISRLGAQKSEIVGTINDLSTILKQNQNLVSGDGSVVTELVVEENVVDEIDPMNQSVECWTCGSQVERQAIADQLASLEDLVEQKRERRRVIEGELADLRAERKTLKQETEQHRELNEREATLEQELEKRSVEIEERQTDIDELRDDITEIESELESVGSLDDHDEFEGYERVSELEYERGRLENEIQDVEDEINEIRYLVGKREDLEARRADLTEQITSLRSRVETIQRDVVEQFNTHMETVLDRLQYRNIERVWLERRTENGETEFALHIVREDEAGNVYEDSLDHLSESEREVIGLVVALTGHVVHDVAEQVPFMLLDSLEAIDATRIAELVDYLSSETTYLLAALLEEDAAELPDSYDRIRAEEHLT